MKTCFKCGTTKPLSDYYAHPRMKDGHLNKCKECTKIDSTRRRREKIDEVRAYDRRRASTPKRRQSATEHSKRWRAEDKRRAACHSAVARALRSGAITKSPCVSCGNEKSVAHHDDYDKPLQVTWLCQPCHVDLHKKIFTSLLQHEANTTQAHHQPEAGRHQPEAQRADVSLINEGKTQQAHDSKG